MVVLPSEGKVKSQNTVVTLLTNLLLDQFIHKWPMPEGSVDPANLQTAFALGPYFEFPPLNK